MVEYKYVMISSDTTVRCIRIETDMTFEQLVEDSGCPYVVFKKGPKCVGAYQGVVLETLTERSKAEETLNVLRDMMEVMNS